jgi:hypothetical protein
MGHGLSNYKTKARIIKPFIFRPHFYNNDLGDE